jgi:hypothetical protein
VKIEPEFALFVAAGLLTVVVAVVVGLLVRHAYREERERARKEGK